MRHWETHMIDFEALERAFAPIQDVGKQEFTLEIEGHNVVLAPLLPREEAQAQGYAREWLDGQADTKGDVPKHIATRYLDVLRSEFLSYAIVMVDGLDLRGVEYVATGQETEGGKRVRVPRHVAVRDLITKKRPWSRLMLEIAFGKFSELTDRIEKDSADLVKYEPADLTTELDRAKKRVEDLEQEMERRAKGDPNLMADQVNAIRQYQEAEQESRRGPPAAEQPPAAPEGTRAPVVAPEPPPVAPTPPAEPTPAPPPTEEEWAEFDAMPTSKDLQDPTPEPPESPFPEAVAPPPQEAVASRRAEPRQSTIPATSTPPTGGGGAPSAPPTPPQPGDGVMDSFQDPEEPGVMDAEANRILQARRRMAQEQQAARDNQNAPVVRRATPPHMRGVREDAVSLDATGAGMVGDAPAFRLPTQELSHRGRGRQGEIETDPVQDGTASANPKFVPANKG